MSGGPRRIRAKGLNCWYWLSAVLAQLVCAPLAPVKNPAPSLAPVRHVAIGLCEDYPEETRSVQGVRRDLEALTEMGVRTLRVSIGWDSVEPERDHYDFAFWDAFVDLAEHQGVALIPYVAYTPAWNSAGSPSDFWRTPPRDNAEFAELMAILAARYRGRIHSWELWNEPDNRDYWLGSAAQYAELARRGAEAVHAVDQRIEVISGGLAGHVEFLAELFDRFAASDWLDVVNLHAYYETWNPEPLETIPEYVAQAQHIIQRHGGRQKIWMAEIGYSNFRDGSRVSAQVSAHFAHEHTLEYQAVALVRSLALVLDSPAVSLFAWYELKDPGASDAMIGDVNNRHLGVLFSDYRPKPARFALAWMARLFADGIQLVNDQLRLRPERSGAGVHVSAFLTGRGTCVLIAWLSTPAALPSEPGPGDARADRRERLWVQLPYEARAPAAYWDAVGNQRQPGSVKALSGATELELELEGADVQIVELPVRVP